MNIIEEMNSLSPEMPDSVKKVYQLIESDPVIVIQYTIQQIAMMSGTSVSAVQRFTKMLGFNGYKDFRYAVLEWKQNMDKAGQNDLISSAAVSFSSSIKELEKIDREQIKGLCKEILAADKVILLGRYRSKTVSEKLSMNLNDLGIVCICADDLIGYQHSLYITNESTCVVFISTLGELEDVKDFLEQLNTITKHVWLITSSKKPKMAKLIRNRITIPAVFTGTAYPVSSHFITMAFTEILTICLMDMQKEASQEKTNS